MIAPFLQEVGVAERPGHDEVQGVLGEGQALASRVQRDGGRRVFQAKLADLRELEQPLGIGPRRRQARGELRQATADQDDRE